MAEHSESVTLYGQRFFPFANVVGRHVWQFDVVEASRQPLPGIDMATVVSARHDVVSPGHGGDSAEGPACG